MRQNYDAANELCSSGPSTGACGGGAPAGGVTYRYDTRGERTSRVAAEGGTVGYGDDYYTYGPDGQPVSRFGTDPTIWLHEDATGSVRLTTDTAGNTPSTHNYTPWGQTTATTGTPPPLGYNHQYTDPETGLIYLRARYYDPQTAQFLTRDPLDATTRSAYGYVGNDPLNGSDPSGLCGPFGSGPCPGASLVRHAINKTVSVATGRYDLNLWIGDPFEGATYLPR